MRRRLAAFAALCAVLAVGCDATVATDVTLVSADTVRTEVSVTLTGAAAEAFSSDLELLNRLEKLVEERAGANAAREVSDDRVELRVTDVDAGKVAAASGLTGVGEISVRPGGDGTATVEVPLVAPTELAAALEGTPDPDAVPLLLENTSVVVSVSAGEVTAVSGIRTDAAAGVDVTTDGGVVTVSRQVASVMTGTLTVVASPVGGGWPWPLLAAAAAVAVAVTAAVRARRR